MRLLLVACVGAALLVGACAVAESTPAPITAADAAEMTARGVETACRRHCGELDVYVVDQVFSLTTTAGREAAMPAEMEEAILDRVERAQLITLDQYHAMFEDGLPTDPRAAIVHVGPITELREGVAGIDVVVSTRRDAMIAETHQFRWNGSGWEPATAEETGIPNTTSVS
jgi:hypothetical protein